MNYMGLEILKRMHCRQRLYIKRSGDQVFAGVGLFLEDGGQIEWELLLEV